MESSLKDSAYPTMEAASADDLRNRKIVDSEKTRLSSITDSNCDHETISGGAVVLTVKGPTNSSGNAIGKQQRPGFCRIITKNSLEYVNSISL